MILLARAVGRDGTERVINVEGQSLIWSNTPDWTISRFPGAGRHLDVAAVHQSKRETAVDYLCLAEADWRPDTSLSERTMELHVVATAVNSSATTR